MRLISSVSHYLLLLVPLFGLAEGPVLLCPRIDDVFLSVKKSKVSCGSHVEINGMFIRGTAVCPHTCGNCPASWKSRSPSPLEAEPADQSVTVEKLSNEIESRYQIGLHIPEVDFF